MTGDSDEEALHLLLAYRIQIKGYKASRMCTCETKSGNSLAILLQDSSIAVLRTKSHGHTRSCGSLDNETRSPELPVQRDNVSVQKSPGKLSWCTKVSGETYVHHVNRRGANYLSPLRNNTSLGTVFCCIC